MDEDLNSLTMVKLRTIARENGLKGYSKKRKAELINFLRENLRPQNQTWLPSALALPLGISETGQTGVSSAVRTPRTRPPRPTRPPPPPQPRDPNRQEMDIFEQQEMRKSRPEVKNKLVEWRNWLINHVPKPIRDRASKAFKTFKDGVMSLYNKVAKKESELSDAGGGEEEPFTPMRLEQAFQGALRSFRINGRSRMDVDTFFREVRRIITDLIARELRDLKSAKIQTTAWIRFRIEDDDDGNFETADKAFNSRMMEFFQGSDLEELVEQMLDHMKTQIENPALSNSRFVFDQVLHLDINFNQLNLTRGSSYIPLPEWISRKKAIINPRNEEDEECFKWAVIAALHHKAIGPHPERISKLRLFEKDYYWEGLKETEDFVGEKWNEENWGKLEFPVPISSINIFERNNNISVNVLAVKRNEDEQKEGQFYIVRKSKLKEGKVVDLLLIEDGERRHYTTIKNLSRLLRSSTSSHKGKHYFCRNCLQGFHSLESKNKHYQYCLDNEAVRTEMPKKDSFVKFCSGQYQFKVPFVIYADFEAILQNVQTKEDKDAIKSLGSQISYTRNINRHVPSGFCTYSTFAYGEVPNPTFQYRGEDCVEVFCDHIENEAKRLYHMFPEKAMDPLDKEQRRNFRKAQKCHICLKPFEPWETKVRDHCHYTGKYRGAAHEMCNVRFAIPKQIPVFFHNLSGYDAHLFIRELGKKFGSESIKVIPENAEKYISFEVSVVVDEKEISGSKEKIVEGENAISEGNRLLEEACTIGQDKIDEGKKLIAEGNKLVKGKAQGIEQNKIDEGKNLVSEGKKEKASAKMRARKILNDGKKLVTEGNKKLEVKRTLRFIDSFRFMPSSLDALSKNLVGTNSMMCALCFSETELTHIDHNYYAHGKCKECGEYSRRKLEINPIFDNLRRGCTDEQFRLLLRKGIYPYEYMDDFSRFKETELPPIEKFYSKLNLSRISELEYDHAQRVWKEFDMKSLGDYHDLYLKTDVLLLANVFETFRKTCLEHYKLDPANFYTSPGLAWQACLKQTGVSLELLTDPDMLLMFERGTRGGITQASHRYASANNKYMGDAACSGAARDKFDPKLPSSFIQYLDANNLYGHAMSQKLPTGTFKWIQDLSEFTTERIHELVSSENNEKGYLLEVDISYPHELHDVHNDLPFLPESVKLSSRVEKLVPNLNDKEKYVVHISTLDQALQHGLILKKVHRAIEFDQSAWLKPYIDFNTKLRTSAKNDFEKDFFKLMNNSVFGKTMENIRKHRNIKLVTNKKSYLKKVMQPNFKSRIVFSESLVGCEMGKKCIVMNKPVYIGQAILDLSKIPMYEFHYDYMVPKYNKNVKLCYMDTDSLVYQIQTEDFYKDIAEDVKDRFDTSNYDKRNFRPLPIGLNKKVIGLMKDELGGKIITEFVALRPKLYAYKTITSEEDKKCKGIKKCVVKKTLSFDDYKNCLLDHTNSVTHRKQMIFQNRLHEVYTVEVNKIALTKGDDKRIIQSDGVSTLAHGHYMLQN